MEIAQKRALISIAIIIIGYVFYKLLGLYAINKVNIVSKYYTKTTDLCKVLTKCSDHSYNGTDKSSPSYITGKESSNKRCRATATNLDWRKNFKCQYDDINNISRCFDCLDYDYSEEKCGVRKHDIDDGGTLMPDYSECLSMMGTTERLDKDQIKYNYSFDITDLNDENRKYRGLTNEWWDKHDPLYKCLTAHGDYLNDDWDDGYYPGYNSSNRFRLTACSACFNQNADDKEAFINCMNEQAKCYKDNYPMDNPNCEIVENLI